MTNRIVHIDRWNNGTLRRYHLTSGAIVGVERRRAFIIPEWCHHISRTVERDEAALMLRRYKSAVPLFLVNGKAKRGIDAAKAEAERVFASSGAIVAIEEIRAPQK